MRRTSSASLGFTLLEVLLVLMVMALGALTVINTLPSNQSTQVKQEAQSFFQRVQRLSDEAILAGKDFGLRIDTDKARYQWVVLTSKGWETLSMSGMNTDTDLPEGVAIQMELSGAEESASWLNRSLFDDDEPLFDVNHSLFADERASNAPNPQALPQILLLASGEVTPVRITFYAQDKTAEQHGWCVEIKENGTIDLRVVGEQDATQ